MTHFVQAAPGTYLLHTKTDRENNDLVFATPITAWGIDAFGFATPAAPVAQHVTVGYLFPDGNVYDVLGEVKGPLPDFMARSDLKLWDGTREIDFNRQEEDSIQH